MSEPRCRRSRIVRVRDTLSSALLVVGAGVGGCMSPAELEAQADDEVYAILEQRRAELGATDPFRIDPRTDTLRQRLLAGEAELEPLTLLDCMRIAAENSRTYQERREALYFEALDLTLERWRFDYQPAAGGSAAVTGDLNEAQSATLFSDLAVTKAFASGASFLGTISLDLTRSLATGDVWDAISGFTFDIAQPLLRGFGAEIVLEDLTQAERDVLYEARAYERFRRTFAFDVASRYYRILAQRDTLANERANYESIVLIRERNEAFKNAGRLSDNDLDQARQNELRAQDTLVNVESALETLLDDFKLFLGLPIDAPVRLADAGLDEMGILELLATDLPEEEAIDVALRERLDYHTAVDRVADAGRKLAVAEDDLRMRLDLTGSVSGVSRDGEPFSYASDGATWSLGAVIDIPIDQLPERNVYRAAQIALEVARRNADEFHDAIYADIRQELREVAEQRQRLEIQRGAVELARRRVESTKLSQEAGRAETRDVLEAQESLIQAENQATQAQTDYTLAGLALFRDLGLLRVTEDGVTVALEVFRID